MKIEFIDNLVMNIKLLIVQVIPKIFTRIPKKYGKILIMKSKSIFVQNE